MARNGQKCFLKHFFYEFLTVNSCMPIWMEIKLLNDPGVFQNPKTLFISIPIYLFTHKFSG